MEFSNSSEDFQEATNSNSTPHEKSISKKQKDKRLEPPYHKINDFLDSLSRYDLVIVWGFITDNEFYDDESTKEINENELKEEIYEQIDIAKKMNIEQFQTDEKTIDWIWKKLYKRVSKYSVSRLHCKGLKWWLYDSCFVYAIAPQIKNFELLDKLRFDTRWSEYISSNNMSVLCKTYDLAIRCRLINQTTNKIEYMNKENDGWYGNPEKAKIKCETCWDSDHMMLWEEDIGITSFYFDHMDEVDKYAEKHNWTDNKKYHAIKINKNKVISDEKAKGMNTLRFLEKLKEMELTKPLMRNESDVEKFILARYELYPKDQR